LLLIVVWFFNYVFVEDFDLTKYGVPGYIFNLNIEVWEMLVARIFVYSLAMMSCWKLR